ncbi:MAG: hypothetical protein KZQ91_19425 [Candidatus Thiodiazotropha sp. (ex Lucinoma borealis)]|nr:hypothetical protein [Candidatus Thiodiazotropha sp. (ex Lucinoma borealis)]
MNNNEEILASDAVGSRLFIIGGMLLIVAGMIFGDLYAVFILHPNVDQISSAMAAATTAISSHDADAVWQHFGQLGGFLENAGTKKDTHVHIIHVGYLALLLAFLQSRIRLNDRFKVMLARLFLVMAVVLPVSIFLIHYVGLVYSPLETIGWASISADLSGLLLAFVILIQLWGLLGSARRQPETGPFSPALGGIGWMLLKGGAVLVLLGFLFGAWYAGVQMQAHEARELTILGQIVEQAHAANQTAAAQSLLAYGQLQGERAVAIAAHAHMVEFGLLAMMTSLIQPFIFLSLVWRQRLAMMLLIGGALLPVAVYAEIWFGLLAGGVADIAGLLVIIALTGMLAGVLRHTGAQDSLGEAR